MAIAAIAATMTIAKQRSEQRHPDPRPAEDEAPTAVDINLDAIRSAGL